MTLYVVIADSAPVQKLEDLFKRELVIGASASGSASVDFPVVANAVLGTKFKIVSDCPAANVVVKIAMPAGEVDRLEPGMTKGCTIMEFRSLGPTSIRVSAVGLGTNNFGRNVDLAAARAVVHKALDCGVTLFDSSDVYGRRGGCETILGEILGARRKDIVLVTKFGRPMDAEGKLQGGSRDYVMSAVEASLKRLKTDWIDVYMSHKPDPKTPIEETLRALDDLVRQGKVRAVGSSHMPAAELRDALATSRRHGLSAFACCEDEYSLLFRGIERELLPAMAENGLGLLPYYPIASGLLTGKYKRGAPLPDGSRFAAVKERDYTGHFLTEANWDKIDALNAFAARRGLTLLEAAMSWVAARPQVASVIAGATKPEQVEANVRAAEAKLTAEDMAELDRITAG